MKGEVISFRPGHDLMIIIMADCEKNGITPTDWVLQKIYAAMDKNNQWAELPQIKRSILKVCRHLRWEINDEQSIETLEQVIDWMTKILKR
jgi:hypothetical protein